MGLDWPSKTPWPTSTASQSSKVSDEDLQNAFLTNGKSSSTPSPRPTFEFKEAQLSTKEVYTLYGEKGVGKTTFAEGFPGTVSVLSFDRKSSAPKINIYNNDERIKVYDAVEYYNRDEKLVNESAETTYQYIRFLLKNIKEQKTDWLVIDGVEILSGIAEHVMRVRSGLSPYQGVANLNLWKIRNSVIDEIHKLALDACSKGVIYTCYIESRETPTNTIVEQGTVITRKQIPKYIDSVMWETDIVLKIESNYDIKTKQTTITLHCDTSKNDNRIQTGTVINITGKKANDVINF